MGRKKIKPIVTDELMGLNPLAGVDFKILIRRITDGKKFTIDDGVTVPLEIELEQEGHVKLFTKSENRKIASGLNDVAKRLFFWIVYQLESGKDYLWINREAYMSEVGVTSVNTYKKGLAELVRLTILCPSAVKGVYWINPKFVFCGSRMNKYPKNVVEYSPKSKK